MTHETLSRQLLSALDPSLNIVDIGQLLAEAVERDSDVANLVKEIHGKIPGPLVSRNAQDKFEQLGGASHAFSFPDISQSESLLVATLWASVRASLKRSDTEMFRGAQLKKTLEKIGNKAAALLKPEFLGELLLDAQRECIQNPMVGRQLQDAITAIRAAFPDFESQLKRADVALSRKCTLGGRPCGVVCWIIVIIIIIIIILLP